MLQWQPTVPTGTQVPVQRQPTGAPHPLKSCKQKQTRLVVVWPQSPRISLVRREHERRQRHAPSAGLQPVLQAGAQAPATRKSQQVRVFRFRNLLQFLQFLLRLRPFRYLHWECTDTYSPVAIAMAPAANPATPVNIMFPCAAWAEATPRTKLAVEMMPSLAPKTAARSQPTFSILGCSLWRLFVIASHSIQIWECDSRIEPRILLTIAK